MPTLRPYIFSPNPDIEHSTLRSKGRIGAIPDMQKQELLAAGFTGALPDLLKQFSLLGLNQAPTDIQLSSSTVIDTASFGTVVGTFTTTDPNAGDTHIYSLANQMFGPSQFGVSSPFMTKLGDLVFTIYRRFPYGADTVDYAITDGTGVLSTDYSALDALSGTLSFVDREIYKTITIATLADGVIDKTVICTLGLTTGRLIAGENIGTGTIMEPTNGIVYFDSVLGDDSNDGSLANPYQTFAIIETVLGDLEPGDACLFMRGQTFSTSVNSIISGRGPAGAGGSPVIIGAYGTYTDPDPIISRTNSGNHMDFRHPDPSYDNTIMQDINFDGGGTGGGLVIGDGTGGNFAADFTLERVSLNNTTEKLGIKNVINMDVRFCEIHDNDATGCFSSGNTGLVFEYCNFTGNGTSDLHDWAIYSSHNITSTVRYNTFNSDIQGLKSRGDTTYTAYGNIIENMEGVHHSGGGSSDISGYSVTTLYTFYQNLVHGKKFLSIMKEQSGSGEPTVAGEMLKRADIYSNIFVDSDGYDFNGVVNLFDNTGENIKYYNNVFIANQLNTLFQTGVTDAIGFEFRNNIVMRNTVGSSSDEIIRSELAFLTNNLIDNNLYYINGVAKVYDVTDVAEYSSLAAFQSAHPTLDQNSIEGDPLFTDIDNLDFTLQPGSPAIGAGADLSATVLVDFYGGDTVAPMDIGAHKVGAETSDRFNIVGDELRVLYPLTASTQIAPIRTTDQGSLSYNESFNITVTQASVTRKQEDGSTTRTFEDGTTRKTEGT